MFLLGTLFKRKICKNPFVLVVLVLFDCSVRECQTILAPRSFLIPPVSEVLLNTALLTNPETPASANESLFTYLSPLLCT